MTQYFEQEHFSLKRLLQSAGSSCRSLGATKVVVHTRTDASIHSIPVTRKGRKLSRTQLEKLESIFEPVDELAVEHLSMIRTEQGIRDMLHAWSCSARQRVLLVFADMGITAATEQINYARMQFESGQYSLQRKSLVFILHYPPSSLLHSPYPALFLDGWEHTFLDGISQSGESANVEYLVRKACLQGESLSMDADDGRSLSRSLMAMLPRIVPLIAAHGLLDTTKTQASFSLRTDHVNLLLGRNVGSSTTAEILCERFAKMWLSHGLMRTMTRASQSLVEKTTQLSMSTAVNSVLQETFTAFITSAMHFINQWHNAQFLTQGGHSRECEAIIELVLNDFPTPPFEELLLHQSRKTEVQLLPFAKRSSYPCVRFPFFYFVSSFLDEVVENSERHLTSSSSIEHIGLADMLHAGEAFISADISPAGVDSKFEIRRQLVGRILQVVADEIDGSLACSENGVVTSLFDDYLQQFVEWKVGCQSSLLLTNFLRRKMMEFVEEREKSLLAIHIAARGHEVEISRAAAATEFVSRMIHFVPNKETMGTDDGDDMFAVAINHCYERVCRSPDSWHEDFWNCMHHAPFLHTERRDISGETIARIRALLFMYVLEVCESNDSTKVAAKEVCFVKDNLQVFAMEGFFRVLGVGRGGPSPVGKEALCLLRVFSSPPLLVLSRDRAMEDFSCLLSFIEWGNLEKPRRDFAVSMLENFVSLDGHCDPGVGFSTSSHTMILLNQRIDSIRTNEFSSDGDRQSLPHFIPNWLVGNKTSTSGHKRSGELYFDNFAHTFKGELSNVVFHMILKLVVSECEERTSEAIFVQLQSEIDREIILTKQEHERLSRLRRTSRDSVSMQGTSVAAMFLDARLILLVCSIAAEIALSGQAAVLEGVHRPGAVEFLSRAMRTQSLDLQSLFFATIVRIVGEMQAFALVSQEPLMQFDWSKRWANGVPQLQERVKSQLVNAETKVRDFVSEEERKSREWRLCPHCQRPFIVAARNCGNFACGKTDGGSGLGCGAPFHIDTAGFYKVDEDARRRLESELDSVRQLSAAHAEDSVLWQRAREMRIPAVWTGFHTFEHRKTICPSIAAPQLSIGTSSSVDLLSLLTRWREFLPQLRILPDLIEVRMKWGDRQRAVAHNSVTCSCMSGYTRPSVTSCRNKRHSRSGSRT